MKLLNAGNYSLCNKHVVIQWHSFLQTGFCGGGHGLSWAVEPRKGGRRRRCVLQKCSNNGKILPQFV